MKKFKKFFDRYTLWIVLVLLVVARLWPIFLGQTLVFGDNFSLMVPGKLFTAHWLKQGVLPLWNPTILGGIPWLADINQSVLYPSTLLFMWLSPAWALNVNTILHLGFTFVGAYLLAEKLKIKKTGALVAAILWTLSPQLTGALNNISIIQSLAWVPWVAWAGLGVSKTFRSKIVFAFFIMGQFLAGYPPHVIFSIFLAVIFSLRKFVHLKSKRKNFWSWCWQWLQTGVITIALSSWIWWPFLEVLSTSTRVMLNEAQLTATSLNPAELVKLIFPYFFEKPAAGYRWGPNWNGFPIPGIYAGWLGLLAIGLSLLKKFNRDDWWWLGLILGGLLLALGNYLPGFTWLMKNLPLGEALRGPSTILFVSALVMALWIGQKISQFKVSKKLFEQVLRWLLAGTAFALGLWVLVQFGFSDFYQVLISFTGELSFLTFEKASILLPALSLHLFLHCIFLTLAWIGLKKSQPLFFLMLILDMTYFTQAHLFFGPNQLYDQQKYVFQEQLQDPQYRTLTMNFNQDYTDFGAYWDALTVRQPFLDSYVDAQELNEFNHLAWFKTGLTPDWNMAAQVPVIHGYTTLMPQNMNEIFNETDEVAINNLPPINLENLQLQNWAVKYYLVDTWWPYQTDVEDLEPIAIQDQWELYELPALARFRYEDGTEALMENYRETPNKISFELENSLGHEYLIMADRYDAHWQVEVDGEEVELENFEGMRRVVLRDTINVTFSYNLI